MHLQAGNSTRVDCKRNGLRIDYERECVLKHNGTKYSCLMKNFSISGVLVSEPNFPPAAIRLGDTCSLSLCADPTAKSVEYNSRVTRLDPSNIALYFLNVVF
jgi:hypothetical protein